MAMVSIKMLNIFFLSTTYLGDYVVGRRMDGLDKSYESGRATGGRNHRGSGHFTDKVRGKNQRGRTFCRSFLSKAHHSCGKNDTFTSVGSLRELELLAKRKVTQKTGIEEAPKITDF